MKLLNKTNWSYIIVSLLILISGSTVVYFRVIQMLDLEITEHLMYEKGQVENKLKHGDTVKSLTSNIGDQITVTSPDRIGKKIVFFKDTILPDRDGDEDDVKEYIPYRQLLFNYAVNGKTYDVVITKSLVEHAEFKQKILTTIVFFCILLLFLLFVVNRWTAKTLWAPFYNSLNKVKKFEIGKHKSLDVMPTNIDEFKDLNDALVKMTNKMSSDYINLKEFTENTSHEIQTPLAIIKSRLELLIQSENLGDEQTMQIKSAYEAASRLSKLNQALLLLTRIENRQFPERETIKLKALIEDKLQNMDVFIKQRKIDLAADLMADPIVSANTMLIGMLASNLLSNAIKHNIDNGKVHVMLTEQMLTISNTGDPLPFAPEKMFVRFQKSQRPDSTGLGMAIVKKICDFYGYKIAYEYREGMHRISVVLN